MGFVATLIPFASRASFLPWAVPDEPVMIAPACPICLPGGAWKPAMYPTTGVDMLEAMNSAAFSSWLPPISPTITTRSVSGSASKRARMSMNELPTTGSPPMPTTLLWPMPTCASSFEIW